MCHADNSMQLVLTSVYGSLEMFHSTIRRSKTQQNSQRADLCFVTVLLSLNHSSAVFFMRSELQYFPSDRVRCHVN